jgi:hypothetical protein
VAHFSSSDDGVDLANNIRQGTATAISDGSYQSSLGTSAFVLRSTGNVTKICGLNAVPGPKETQSAYRSKLAGVSGSLAILASICSLHQISSGKATVGLDGNQALKIGALAVGCFPTQF